MVYEAALAGLSYEIEAKQSGIFLKVAGFHDKLSGLLDLLLSELTSMTIDEYTFDVIKAEVQPC